MGRYFHLKDRDFAVLVAYALILGVVFFAGRWLSPSHAQVLVLIAAFVGLGFIILESFRRLEPLLYDSRDNYRQLEALHSTYASLDVAVPLPPLRGWAVSPDFLNIQIACLRECRPRLVVELGSGVSTLVSGLCLKSLGSGRVLALDHEAEYAEKTRSAIRAQGIGDVADVLTAPLVTTALKGGSWQWYDLGSWEKDGDPIDLLIIDGPPNPLQPLSRYPAVPLLFERLSERAIVLVDDAGEPNVEQSVRRWLSEFPCLTAEFFDTEKGTYVIRRGSGESSN